MTKTIERDTFNVKIGRSYCEIGRAYKGMGDHAKSEIYYKKGIPILEHKKSYRTLLTHYMGFAGLYNNIGTIESYRQSQYHILQKADSITQIYDVGTRRYTDLQSLIAQQYVYPHNYDFKKATYYYSNNIKRGLKDGDSIVLSRTYNNLSHTYLIAKNDSAGFFIKKGLDYVITDYIAADLYSNQGHYYAMRGELLPALENSNTALETNLEHKIDVLEAPDASLLNKSSRKDKALLFLKTKNSILIKLYQENLEEKYLKAAIKNVEAVEVLIQSIQSSTLEEFTKLVWLREASQAYVQGVYAAHLLGDKTTAFALIEKNKALLLSESILKNTEFSNLPKHITDKETSFKKQIYELENKLSNDSKNSTLLDSLFGAKQAYEIYIDSIAPMYPEYFSSKINIAQIPLAEAKNELKKDQLLVSYIWNQFDEEEELLMGQVLSKDTVYTFQLNQAYALKNKITAYRDLISKPQSTQADVQAYQEVAYELYHLLFPSEEIRDQLKDKHLIIIPDGDLQNIPFESLVTSEDGTYLIEETMVSYAYSMSFLMHNQRIDRKAEGTIVGFSPSTYDHNNLADLTQASSEVNDILTIWEGEKYMGEYATKDNFLQHSGAYKIIHLATHAESTNNPSIAFSDEVMNLHELYTYRNQADLVVLSACNTSLGEIAAGEGVFSLARGFFYSGANSVVPTLWNVNDKSGSLIMTDFYRNLKDGMSKPLALHKAKLKYINTHSLSSGSPHYWAPYILIGDSGEIPDVETSYFIYVLIALGLLLIVGSIFFLKRKKS